MPGFAVADLTALQVLLAGLTKSADRPLVCYRDRWHSGSEVAAKAAQFASQMQAAGLRAGQCVWIIVTDNLSAMQMQIGAWMLGACTLMLDFRSTAHRFAQLRDVVPPDLVVCTRRVTAVQGFNPLLLSGQSEVFKAGPLPADLPADYLATSGSTGLPKLKKSQQDKLGLQIGQMPGNGVRGPWGVALSALSVAYPASRSIWWRNIAAGIPVIALDLLYNLTELDAALQRPDVEECTLPPSLIRRLAQRYDGAGPRYPHLKKLQSVGGPALPADKLLAVRRLTPNYLMTYSSTECGVISRITGAEVLERPASCGQPLAGLKVTIHQAGQPCAVGEVGEIAVVCADHVRVLTGDIGWLDADGYLYVTGRVQGSLCRNGVNFSADRITQAALMSPSVRDAVVIALPGGDGGDQVHLLLEASPSQEQAIKTMLHQLLPASEQPDQIHFHAKLPCGPGGKVDGPLLREILTGGLDG